MLVPFLIMLREGIEAALIVGIIASYLQQTGRGQWMPAVWIGVFLAAALALLVGGGLELVSAEFPQKQQELFEGIVGLVAVGILSSMVFWMRKVARSIKHSLHASLDHALAGSKHQVTALILMVFFAVAREGLDAGDIHRMIAADHHRQRAGFQDRLDARTDIGMAFGSVSVDDVGVANVNDPHRLRQVGAIIFVVIGPGMAKAEQGRCLAHGAGAKAGTGAELGAEVEGRAENGHIGGDGRPVADIGAFAEGRDADEGQVQAAGVIAVGGQGRLLFIRP